MRESVVKAHKAGVKLAYGTDAGVFEHGDKRTDQHSWIPWTAPSGPCAFLR